MSNDPFEPSLADDLICGFKWAIIFFIMGKLIGLLSRIVRMMISMLFRRLAGLVKWVLCMTAGHRIRLTTDGNGSGVIRCSDDRSGKYLPQR